MHIENYIDAEDLEEMKEFRRSETPGGNLRFYRKLKELTQDELAAAVGTTKQAVSAMENNRRSISKNMAKQLSSILSTDISSFIF